VNLTVSGPIKVFAVVAALAAVALVGGMMFLGRPPAEADAAPIVLPTKKTGLLKAIGKAKVVGAKANASAARPAKVAAGAKAKAAAKPKATRAAPAAKAPAKAAKVHAKPKLPPKAQAEKHYRGIAANGLPMRIAVALNRHSVVVVAVWSKGGKIDEMARDEAARGAGATGAAFVPLDVLGDAREAEALTLKLGIVLHAPGVLIFTRPNVLALTLDGFRDHETVAQAAANALR
jgi:hypothetical protein